ncbi:MAG: hypothetical protein AAGB04_28420, partial [Pseudomonadota bacterium]
RQRIKIALLNRVEFCLSGEELIERKIDDAVNSYWFAFDPKFIQIFGCDFGFLQPKVVCYCRTSFGRRSELAGSSVS